MKSWWCDDSDHLCGAGARWSVARENRGVKGRGGLGWGGVTRRKSSRDRDTKGLDHPVMGEGHTQEGEQMPYMGTWGASQGTHLWRGRCQGRWGDKTSAAGPGPGVAGVKTWSLWECTVCPSTPGGQGLSFLVHY